MLFAVAAPGCIEHPGLARCAARDAQQVRDPHVFRREFCFEVFREGCFHVQPDRVAALTKVSNAKQLLDDRCRIPWCQLVGRYRGE